METIKEFIFPIVLLVVGIVLISAREETSKRPGKGAVIKVLGIEIPALNLTGKFRAGMQALGVVFLVLGAVLGVVVLLNGQKTPPAGAGVSLVSATYTWGDWDPRQIDFERALQKENGIPVGEGLPFRIYNLVVLAPENAKGIEAWVEIEANGQRVVQTEPVFLWKCLNSLQESDPQNFITKGNHRTWDIPIGCKQILLKLMLRQGQTVTDTVEYPVPLNTQGEAWYTSPPQAAFISVGYTINGQPLMWMDLRDIEEKGLPVNEGDTLTVQEAWYKARFSSSRRTLHLEAYLTKGGYDAATLIKSAGNDIHNGSNPIQGMSVFTWKVRAENNFLILTLIRDDDVVLDRYVVPLHK